MSAAPMIVIIEDDESLRTALVGLMRSCGWGSRGFESAEDFLAGDAPETCACLVTDIHMPGMSGFELTCDLARRRPSLPVIMITGRPEPELEQRAMAAGVSAFHKKPLEHGILISSIETALRS